MIPVTILLLIPIWGIVGGWGEGVTLLSRSDGDTSLPLIPPRPSPLSNLINVSTDPWWVSSSFPPSSAPTNPPPGSYYCLVAKSCLTLCNSMDCSKPGFPVLDLHYLPEFSQTRVHWVNDTTQPSHPLSPSSPPALNLSQHQDLFQWVNPSHQVAKLLEFQLWHQSWIFSVDLL